MRSVGLDVGINGTMLIEESIHITSNFHLSNFPPQTTADLTSFP